LYQDLVDQISATFFRLPHQGLNDRAINLAITRLYEALCSDFTYTAPRLLASLSGRHKESGMLDFTSKYLIKNEKKNTKQTFRVAFVSAHFYHHSIGRMLIELMYFMKKKTEGNAEGYGHIELFAFFMVGQTQPYDDLLTAAFEELLTGKAS
jgi:predicted O-linked N-acetylglucosamine transferase (SPINDLY family)